MNVFNSTFPDTSVCLDKSFQLKGYRALQSSPCDLLHLCHTQQTTAPLSMLTVEFKKRATQLLGNGLNWHYICSCLSLGGSACKVAHSVRGDCFGVTVTFTPPHLASFTYACFVLFFILRLWGEKIFDVLSDRKNHRYSQITFCLHFFLGP